MAPFTAELARAAALLSAIGLVQAAAGAVLAARFARVLAAPPLAAPPLAAPPLIVFKPLAGAEAGLEAALESFFRQDHPRFRLLFGVQDAADAAIATVERLRARFPAVDAVLVVDPTPLGRNRKIANLRNLARAAEGAAAGPGAIVVIADADVLAPPDLLRRLAGALAEPRVGLVSCLYAGRPASGSLVRRLGAAAIDFAFLPGVLLSRALGRRDCLGAVMALRAETLAAVGGFPALGDWLADDNRLGQLVRARGLAVDLAPALVETMVADEGLAALLRHELRWARTIRALAPLPFAASLLQYPLAFALLAPVLAGGAGWSLGWLLAALCLRAAFARGVERSLGLARPRTLRHLWLRDLLSAGVTLAAFASDQVVWRGQTLHTDHPSPARN